MTGAYRPLVSAADAKSAEFIRLLFRAKADIAFCRFGGHTRDAAARSGGTMEEKLGELPQGLCAVAVTSTFVPAHNPRALMSYCVINLYVTIRDAMLAKISSAGRDFRIIGPVEWRAADRPG